MVEHLVNMVLAILANLVHVAHLVHSTMDYLRMDGKRGHVTCGNRSAIELQESFQKFASLEEELLLCSGLFDPTRFRMDRFGEK